MTLPFNHCNELDQLKCSRPQFSSVACWGALKIQSLKMWSCNLGKVKKRLEGACAADRGLENPNALSPSFLEPAVAGGSALL